MNLILPMAGKGSRFSKEGYELPKPLIEVDNKAMFKNAINCLPEAEKIYFVINSEMDIKNRISNEITNSFPNSETFKLNTVLDGQALTCLTVKEKVPPKEELLISACDNAVIADLKSFNIQKESSDVIVWTFRGSSAVVEHPEHYGWVKTKENSEEVESISVKKSISNTPINDHAIVGTFWFREAEMFFNSANTMIEKNDRINNEFYVDQCIKYCVENGLKTKVFEVDKYICWGTPNDLKKYNYWKSFFKKHW